ncbi:TPA: hypothetical protein HA351_03075 [Methanosarcinaceae archaeon]|nr:hypothetical protein [Methanosarcinaceae archaeon]
MTEMRAKNKTRTGQRKKGTAKERLISGNKDPQNKDLQNKDLQNKDLQNKDLQNKDLQNKYWATKKGS